MAPGTRRRSSLLAAVLAFALAVPAGSLPFAGAAVGLDAPRAAAESAARLPLRMSLRKAAVSPARLDARLARAASDSDGPVTVVVCAVPGKRPSAEKAVADAGGTVTGTSSDLVRARVPASGLAGLADSPGVAYVRPPMTPVPAAVTGEGSAVIGAANWRHAGATGAGVKVGVIDVGFAGHASLLGSELPAAVNVWPSGPAPSGEVSHGTEVAEVIHDVAPDAQLYLARVADEVDLGNAAEWLRANGVTVIDMSLVFYGAPLDGGNTAGADNAVNQVVTAAVAGGVFWANAAGDTRRRHWRGDFTDRDGDFAMSWDGGRATNLNVFRYDGAAPIVGTLWWKDSWTAAANDYDLVLFHFDRVLHEWRTIPLPNGEPDRATESGNPQIGASGNRPFEEVRWTRGVKDELYGWAVVNMRPWKGADRAHPSLSANKTAVDFDFFSPNQDLGWVRTDRSIGTPADNESDGFMSVAAVEAGWPPAGQTAFAHQQRYSAEGPTQRGRRSPEIAAPDGVLTATGAGTAFRGTSASSAYLAGAAALMRQRNGWSPTQIEAAVKAGAIDLGSAGADDQTGWGALRLPALTAPAVDIRRISGPDRYRTALAVSRSAFATGSVTTAVVASGAGYADAIAGSGLAGSYGSPILLTPPAGSFPELVTELRRLGATKVVLLGSEAALSRDVATQLQAASFVVERIGGRTRYETAALIARAIATREGASFRHEAFVVYGENYPDALAAAPFAYRAKLPVLPVLSTTVPPAVASAAGDIGVTSVVVAGSTRVVSEDVTRWFTGRGVAVVRAGGATRYDTAKAVADHAVGRGWGAWTWVGIASGENYPDALAGAAAVGANGGVLVPTLPDGLVPQAEAGLRAHDADVDDVRLFGATSALQGEVELGALVLTDR